MQRPQTRAYDTFVWATLGKYLPECLKQVNNVRPRDPIEFIAQWLYKLYDSQLYYRDKVDYLSQLCGANSDIAREKNEHANKLKPIKENIQAERWNYYVSLTQELEALTDYISNEDVPVDEMYKRRFLEVQDLLKEETDYFTALGQSQETNGETKHKTHRGKHASVSYLNAETLLQHLEEPQPSESAQLAESNQLLEKHLHQSSDTAQPHPDATPTTSASSVLKRRSSVEMTVKSSEHKSVRTDSTEADSGRLSRRPARSRDSTLRRLPHELMPRVSKNSSSRKPARRSKTKPAQPSAQTGQSDVNFDQETLSELNSSSPRTQLGAQTSSSNLERAESSQACRTLPGKSHVASSAFFRYVLDGHLSDGSSSDNEFPMTSPQFVNSRDKDGLPSPSRREFSERSSVRHSAVPATSGKKPRAVQLSIVKPHASENTSPRIAGGSRSPHLPTHRSLSEDELKLIFKQPPAAHYPLPHSSIDESSADGFSPSKLASSSDMSKTAKQTRGRQPEKVLGKDKVDKKSLTTSKSGVIHQTESKKWEEEDKENMQDPRGWITAGEDQEWRGQVSLPPIPRTRSTSSQSSQEEAGRSSCSQRPPTSAVVELPAISSVGRAGTLVMTNAGHLAFFSRQLGVIGSNSLKIKNVHPLDTPETWEKKYFQTQTFYDHELYSQGPQSYPYDDSSDESSQEESSRDGSPRDPAARPH